jgi:hypothetical protein
MGLPKVFGLTSLGIKPGAGLYSITGLSTYQLGTANPVPFTNLNLANNEQAARQPASRTTEPAPRQSRAKRA